MESWDIETLSEETMYAVEADAYWMLCKMLDGIQDHYTNAQPGIQRTVFKLKELVRYDFSSAALLARDLVWLLIPCADQVLSMQDGVTCDKALKPDVVVSSVICSPGRQLPVDWLM